MNVKNVITINDFNYSQGGASKVAIDTANMISKSGIKSVFISAVFDNEQSTLSKDVIQFSLYSQEFFHYKNKIKGMKEGIACKSFTRLVGEVLDNFDPKNTVVHVHGWTKACSSDFFRILKSRGFPTFLTLHEYFSFCPNGAYYNYKSKCSCKKKGGSFQCMITNCDSRNYLFKIYRYFRLISYKKNIDFGYIHLIFISEFEKKVISKQLIINKYKMIENPISIIPIRTNKKKYDFVYIGRTSSEKGIDLFINLAQKLPHKNFLIVGNYVTNVNNIEITGWVSEKEVETYLIESKVLVFPSLWPETFGLNVINALYLGIPCLVSSNTAAENYIINGENGYVFQQGDLDDLYLCAIKVQTLISKNETSLNIVNYASKLINYYKGEK